MDQSREKMIMDCIGFARKYVNSVEWDKPEIVEGFRKGREQAFQMAEEGKNGFAPLADKDFDDEMIGALNTVAMNDYYIKMNFWQCVAFMLEAKVRALETILSRRADIYAHS